MALSTEATATLKNASATQLITSGYIEATSSSNKSATLPMVDSDEPLPVSNDWLYILTYLGIGAAAILFICLAIFGLRNYIRGFNTALVVQDTEADKNEEIAHEGVSCLTKCIAEKIVKNKDKTKEENIMAPAYIEKKIKSGDTVTVSADGAKIVCGPYKLYFPTGAVSSDQEVTITFIPGVSRNDKSFCIAPTLRCCPSGSKFKKPVKVVLKSSFGSRIKIDLVEVPIFTRHDETKPWEKVEKVQLGTDGCLTYEIKHFSDYSPQPNRRELRRLVCFLTSMAWLKHSGQNLRTLQWYIYSRGNESIDTVMKSHKNEGSPAIGCGEFGAKADKPLLMQLAPTTGLSIRPLEIRIEPKYFNGEICTVPIQFIIKNENAENPTCQRYAIKQTNSAGGSNVILGSEFSIVWEDLARTESTQSVVNIGHAGEVHVVNSCSNHCVPTEDTPLIGRQNSPTARNSPPSTVTRRNPTRTSSNRLSRRETTQRYSSTSTSTQSACRPLSQELRNGLPADRNARPSSSISSSSNPYSTLERSYQPTNNRDENTIETGGWASVRDRVSFFDRQFLSRT